MSTSSLGVNETSMQALESHALLRSQFELGIP